MITCFAVCALSQARTPLVAMLDVDMLVSKDLYTSLLSDTARDALMKVREGHGAVITCTLNALRTPGTDTAREALLKVRC